MKEGWQWYKKIKITMNDDGTEHSRMVENMAIGISDML
jgi:hypothetical protein